MARWYAQSKILSPAAAQPVNIVMRFFGSSLIRRYWATVLWFGDHPRVRVRLSRVEIVPGCTIRELLNEKTASQIRTARGRVLQTQCVEHSDDGTCAGLSADAVYISAPVISLRGLADHTYAAMADPDSSAVTEIRRGREKVGYASRHASGLITSPEGLELM